jgi:hypothetical protein
MASIHVGDLPEGTKRCRICAEPINAARANASIAAPTRTSFASGWDQHQLSCR